MRPILALSVILLFSFNAHAKVDEPRDGEIKATAVEMPAIAYSCDIGNLSGKEIDLAILYKMKENIIRRELSFTLGKKWLKWV